MTTAVLIAPFGERILGPIVMAFLTPPLAMLFGAIAFLFMGAGKIALDRVEGERNVADAARHGQQSL